MIQRIQSVYLFITLICLIIISLGVNVFTSSVHTPNYAIETRANVYGVQKDVAILGELSTTDKENLRHQMDRVDVGEDMVNVPTFYFPFYTITILLSMLAVIVLLGYKNLKRQLKLGRLLFVLNFLLFLITGILFYIFRSGIEKEGGEVAYLSFGFYIVTLAVAFSFLANSGINRDLKLIKSIDRIR